MANKNVNLQNAKNIKDDEFYTTYKTIEKEILQNKITEEDLIKKIKNIGM